MTTVTRDERVFTVLPAGRNYGEKWHPLDGYQWGDVVWCHIVNEPYVFSRQCAGCAMNLLEDDMDHAFHSWCGNFRDLPRGRYGNEKVSDA